MNNTDRLKMANFLSKDPSFTDYARVGGRTALEGGAGAYGGSALAALLGLLITKNPNASAKTLGMLQHLPALGGGLGAGLGAVHGFNAASSNMKDRLGPMGRLKSLFGQ